MQALGGRSRAVAPADRFRGFTRLLSAGTVAWLELAGILSLGLATIGTRLLTRSQFLYNWDAVQYALGIQRFDLVAHRPHPPGYAGYIVLGRLFTSLSGGDPGTGLVLLSATGEAVAVVLVFLLAREQWGRFAGWAAALLFVTSPLTWIYGSVALNYALEPALVLAVTWGCLRACAGSRVALLAAAAVVAAAGAIRPTDELFLLLPLAWAAWRTWSRGDRRGVAAASAAVVAISLGWLVPMIAASGGLATYLAASRELSAKASDTSAIWKAGPGGTARNAAAVVAGLATALGLVIPLGVASVICNRLVGGGRSVLHERDRRVLAGALLLPATAVYLLVHIGQLGYLLLLVPTLLLPAGMVILGLARLVSPRHQGVVAGLLLAASLAVNVFVFAVPAGGMRDQVIQHDQFSKTLLSLLGRYDPATTVLLTSAEADGAYRMVEYYLPSFPVIAVGRDRRNHAGTIFASHVRGGQPGVREYDLAGFEHSAPLALPATTRTVVVLDPAALAVIGDRLDASVVMYGDEWRLWQVALPANPAQATAFGRFLYLSRSSCPCEGATAARPVLEPHQPL